MKRYTPNQSLQAYYDCVWSSPDKEISTRLRFQTSCRKFALECLGDLKGKKILEIGPGQGQETLLFAKEGAQVYALDISSKSLKFIKSLSGVQYSVPDVESNEQTAKDTGQINFIHANAEQLPFKGETFDRVFAQTMLMHTDALQIAKECARILRSGGKAVFMEPLKGNPLLYVYRNVFSPFKFTFPRYIGLKEGEQMGRYFKMYLHREFYLTALVGISVNTKKALYQKIKQNLERIDNWLMQRLPPLRALCWMTVMCFEK
jgi:ubiquinone/menaquinone biosynthesis C-methylase UbiE